MKKPLIGVTTAVREVGTNGFKTLSAYTAIIASLERAGGLPVMIPVNVSDDTLRGIYQRLDGVLLPGGGDIDPMYFHEERHPATYGIDPLRDNAEVKLAQWAAQDDLPLFGICRGHQVLNVALGGTLIQDIATELPNHQPEDHSLPENTPRNTRNNRIKVSETSRLAQIIGETDLPVNSLHHQAVKTPAPGFVVTAYAEDGIIEAIEMPDKRFLLSVQWHPEDLSAEDPHMQALFDAFVAACAATQ
jgi:putative glutamine amidotransferase